MQVQTGWVAGGAARMGRLASAALAALILLAAAGAQELKVTELTTYAGTVPCADCLAIKEVVSLRPDGLFYRQRDYQKTQLSGQRVQDVGHWTTPEKRLALESSLGDKQEFEVLANGELQALDQAGRPARAAASGSSKTEATLAREAQAYVPPGTYRLRGIYTQGHGRARLQPCGCRLEWGAENTGRPKMLERLAEATKGGRAALLTVSAMFEASTPGKEVVRITNVVTAEPGGKCEALSDAVGPRTALTGGAKLVPAGLSGGDQKSQSEASAPLLDTQWVLIELANAPVPAGEGQREATIRFQTEGRVSGFTGCNRFSGSYTLEGRLLHFGPLATTRMACADDQGVEGDYMKALEATRQFQIHRGTLDLLDGAGRNAARFKAVLGR